MVSPATEALETSHSSPWQRLGVLVEAEDAEGVRAYLAGLSPDEIARALDVGIFCFNVESEAELELLAQLAADRCL